MPHTSLLSLACPYLWPFSFVSLSSDLYGTEHVTVDTLSKVSQLCSFYPTLP